LTKQQLHSKLKKNFIIAHIKKGLKILKMKRASLILNILASISAVVLSTVIYLLSDILADKTFDHNIVSAISGPTVAFLISGVCLILSVLWHIHRKNKGENWSFPIWIWIVNGILFLAIIILLIVMLDQQQSIVLH